MEILSFPIRVLGLSDTLQKDSVFKGTSQKHPSLVGCRAAVPAGLLLQAEGRLCCLPELCFVEYSCLHSVHELNPMYSSNFYFLHYFFLKCGRQIKRSKTGKGSLDLFLSLGPPKRPISHVLFLSLSITSIWGSLITVS